MIVHQLKREKMKFKYFVILLLLLFNTGFSQQIKTRFAIAPFLNNGLEPSVVNTIETLFRLEFQKYDTITVISHEATSTVFANKNCFEKECAIAIGKELKADMIVICQLLILGQKIVVQYSCYNVQKEITTINDQVNSANVEDLDMVMKRVVQSILSSVTYSKTAEVGNITEDEKKEILSRSTRKFYNFNFGYLFPDRGYSTNERSFSMDFRAGGEIDNYDYGIQLLARDGFGVNIFGSYLITKKDVCPYLGAGVGFHWILKEQAEIQYNTNGNVVSRKDKKGDGIELLLNGGLRLFHTYNFRIIINMSYAFTFNDFNSRGYTFTVGFLY